MNSKFCFLLALTLLSGCAQTKNTLLTNGYYSNGNKFLYCKNPNLFNKNLIEYINETQLKDKKVKVSSAFAVESATGDDNDVRVPLQCKGNFQMTDNSVFSFDITISIPDKNSPRIDSLHVKRNNSIAEKRRERYISGLHSAPVTYCNDLMKKVRDSYGKAPFCTPIIGRDGEDITSLTNTVELSDEIYPPHPYDSMVITPGELKGDYYYDKNSLDSLIDKIKYSGKGNSFQAAKEKNISFLKENLNSIFKEGKISKKNHDKLIRNLNQSLSHNQ